MPRRSRLVLTLLVVTALGLAACGQPGAPHQGGHQPDASGSTDGTGNGTGRSTAGAAGGGLPGGTMPTRIGDIELEVAAYPVPEILDAAGGAELSRMLDALGLTAADVTLVIAVDPGGRLDIGRWQLPGRSADAIMSAWEAAAGSGWRRDTLEGEPSLVGNGADGSQAWAVARDDVFLYVVADDRDLVEAAVSATG